MKQIKTVFLIALLGVFFPGGTWTASAESNAAPAHLLDASAWGDYELERDDILDIKDARDVGQRMILGIRCDSKRVSEAMKHIGRGIQQLGKKIKSVVPGPQVQTSPECDEGPPLLV